MERLTYRPISLEDFEPYTEFLSATLAVACKLGAVHERDTEIRGGPVAIYASAKPG